MLHMKKILYIGNKLKHKNSNVSSIEILGNLLEKEGFQIFYASEKVNKVLRLLDMVFSFFRYLRKIDYIIIDTYSTHNFYYALIISQLARLFKVNYIPSLNGGNLPARLYKHPMLSGLIFNHAHTNISPSLYLVEEFNTYGYTNVKFIPNTIQIENYIYRERNYDEIKLLWVRSFAKIYNPKLAIDVLKQLKDNGREASLCMVGPDSDGTLLELQKYAKDLSVDVEFAGKLSKEDWIKKSEAFNIFINTTNFDNMPVSVIEAMALGLPVVSTNVGGIPFLIEHEKEGVLVDENDIMQMTDAILKIANNPTFANILSRNARSKVELYDWSIVKGKWFSLFQEINL